MFKRFINPHLLFNNDDAGGGGGKPAEDLDESGKPKGPEFPADTAVKDMTPEQQAAYWKHKARKHEDRVKEFGALTPDQVRKNAEDLEELRKSKLPEAERAIEEAVERGRKEAAGNTASKVAETALRMALRGRVLDGSLALSLPSFVKDGEADIDALEAWVDENSEPSGGGQRHVNQGQGKRETFRTTGRETGLAAAEKRFGKKA